MPDQRWVIETITTPSGRTVQHLQVLPGPVEQACWDAFTQVLADTPADMPVLLSSEDMAIPQLPEAEHTPWIIAAGQYRQAQERFLHRGGCLLSLVTARLTGGTYLIHGMAATHRFIYQDAKVYPALSPEAFTGVFKDPYPHEDTPDRALAEGLVTTITSPQTFPHHLDQSLQ